jgi:FtsH-binding integral membrane protein
MNQNYNNFNNGNDNNNFNGSNFDPIDMTRNYSNQVRQIIQESEVVNKSFLFMGLALLLTALSAIITANTDFVYDIILGGRFAIYGILFAEFAIVIGATHAMKKNMLALSAVLFTLYSIINGVTLSIIFFVYTQQSIMYVFIVTTIVFLIMAVIGLVTKVDLTKLGGFLLMGLVGLIVASISNLFFRNDTMDFLLTIIGIGIFMGLTAYDMQKIKRMQYENPEYSTNVLALYGAMSIYLDFINLFLRLLRLLGRKR